DRGGEAHGADHVEALVAVARGAAGAADVAVGMDADGAVGDGGGEDGQGIGKGHSKIPGRTTRATGRRVSRMRTAAQSTSASIASASGARHGTPKRSSSASRVFTSEQGTPTKKSKPAARRRSTKRSAGTLPVMDAASSRPRPADLHLLPLAKGLAQQGEEGRVRAGLLEGVERRLVY